MDRSPPAQTRDPRLDGGEGVQLIDTIDAARLIGCTPGYLKNLRGTGDGPKFTRLFRRKGIRYDPRDIARWREERSFGSTTEYPENLG